MSFEYFYVFPFAISVCVLATASGFSGAVLFQPFFYFVLKIPVASSIATGIATETIGMSGGAYRYAKMGYHDYGLWKKCVPFALAGALAGFFFFLKLPAAPLKAVVGVSMLLVAVIQLLSVYKKKSNKQQPKFNRWLPAFFCAGAFSASTGTGVAEMSQPLIEHAGGVPTKKANATAILLEATVDWLITFLNLNVGNIRFDILLFSVSGVLIGSQIGPRLAPYLPDKILKTVFSIGVGFIGLFYIWSYIK